MVSDAKPKKYRSHGFCLLLVGAAIIVAPASAKAETIVVHAGRLIDGVSQQARERMSIVIIDDRITDVKSGFIDQPGAQVIDLSDQTVLPGLIDCHDHTTYIREGNPQLYALTHSAVQMMPQAVMNARKELDAGFTSIREVGSGFMMDRSLKDAINNGVIPGPRMWIALESLGPTGGHSDESTDTDPDLYHPHWSNSVIDGVDAAIKAVRDHKKRGADLIKIHTTGGVGSVGDDPNRQLMRDDEIKAVVDTAHALGMKVAAHAHGKPGIDAALRNGVDSIEHSSFADAGSFTLFKQHGAYMVPTLAVAQGVLKIAREHPERLNRDARAKIEAIAPVMINTVRLAHEAGVKIAFGTDSAGEAVPHGKNAREFTYLVQAGLTPMEAIKTATTSAADLLGASTDVGSIQPGRYADIIAVRGDPLKDVAELENVSFVMKGGAVFRHDAARIRAAPVP